MPTTTNYGWTTPADTDLVKDGASAIRTLGNGVDTSLKTVSDGRGLVHINTTTMSAVASQSVSDVFSSTYDNYRILVNITSTSSTTDIGLRMRVSGSDNTTAGNYRWSGVYVASNGSTVTGVFSGAGESAFRIGGIDQTGYINLDIFNPFASVETGFTGLSTDISATPVEYNFARGGIMTVTTSYTGFTIFTTSAGNLTGSISVYGYKK
jgi:hypothetical protein